MTKLLSWGELKAEGLSERQIRTARKLICKQCDMLQKGHCGYCGCSIVSTTAQPHAKCPINKW